MDTVNKEQGGNGLSISEKNYGFIGDQGVTLFQLENKDSMLLELTNYGGIITKIIVPDKNGNLDDVVLGYDDLAQYIDNTAYFGALVGRFANRIAHGEFTLNDQVFKLETNNGPNALHGGTTGFDKKIWTAASFKSENGVGVKLHGVSKNEEEGYPGNLQVTVTYTLNIENELHIGFHAETDQSTVVNFTNHSYFNLKGSDIGSITNHIVQINASTFTPVDETSIPTGEIRSVSNTPFDFRKPLPIGKRINNISNSQIKISNGYDHNFILDRKEDGLQSAATVYEPSDGRVLEVLTTQPGMQFYTANYLDGKFKGKNNHVYSSRDAFCLETQHYPDAPNQADFPSTVLNLGEKFKSTTVYKFSVRKD